MSSPSDPDARLRIRALTKRFGTHTVLDGVDLDVGAGSIVLLSGSNGSGKTTLLRGLAGLASYRGTVTLDGQVLDGDPRRREAVGYLPQSVGLPEWATVAEVLDLFGHLRRATTTVVPLPDGFLPDQGRPIGQLSGGQRQRVAFTVALLGTPRLLLLDEPAANLDEQGREALTTVLHTVRDTGASILIAAPSPADLDGVPDRHVRLVDGRIDAPPELRLLPTTADPAPRVQGVSR